DESLPSARLFLALHPHCPCSQATVSELSRILTRAPGTAEVTVLLYKPSSESDEWVRGTLLDRCRGLRCKIRIDEGGLLAASLGCLTSGSVVVYDAHGQLRYQGGITISRGHEGDNAGERAVTDILNGTSI